MDRRNFIRTGLTGLAGLSVMGSKAMNLNFATTPESLLVDKVKLGGTGLTVSRIAMGTGSVGDNYASNQTRLGMDKFVKLAHLAYERGINFYDMADTYGSMPYVGNAIKTLQRDKIVLLSKIRTFEDGSDQILPVEKTLDRFRSEVGSDYFDVILMHAMWKSNWAENRKYYMDALYKAKQDGIVKKLGVSIHDLGALAEAAVNPWVDVIMARINPYGDSMDGSVDAVNSILKTAIANGKGIIGMKIFAEGKRIKEEERQHSLEFAINKGNVHCVTLGMESEEQLNDAADRVIKIVANKKDQLFT